MAKNKDNQKVPPSRGRMTGKFVEQIVTALLLLMLIVSAFTLFSGRGKTTPEVIAISQVAQDITSGKVNKLTVKGDEVTITYRSVATNTDQVEKTSKKETEASLSDTLKNYGVTAEQLAKVAITMEDQSSLSFWLMSLAPFLLSILSIIFIIWLLSRQMKGASMQAFSFGQSRARIVDPNDQSQKVTFKDVAGVKEAKEELKEIVDFLKNPKKFLDIGARIPKGVLLMGAPGTGKTLLARAVAGEAHVPFMYLSGSEFVEMFVGVGASVTGDTPVLVKTEKDGIKLKMIAEVVDSYYKNGESDRVKKIYGLQTLGLAPLKTRFRGAQSKDKQFFGGSQWSNVQGVLRHKVNEIYTIHYLGGKIRTTGDHSVFIRDRNMIRAKKASELKTGDILVNLPFKVRGLFVPGLGTTHSVRQHSFEKNEIVASLNLYNDDLVESEKKYSYALEMSATMSQCAIAEKVGVSQATVGHWQNRVHRPQFLTNNLIAAGAPSQVLITTGLLRLMGYYTAEGRTEKYYTQFVFGLHEKDLHTDCAGIIRNIFKLEPQMREVPETNSFRINISSPIVASFFEKHIGTGSKNKHLPQFLWTATKDQFLAFLEGYSRGDGYTTKDGKLSITSVSQQMIRELAWLAGMHGIQTGIRKMIMPAGRTINGGKPLPETIAWNLIIGKSSHPFKLYDGTANQFKKPVVQKVEKESYDGYVYDFCGCDHEAFFGGEKPILLHNSRVRDLFKMAKSVAPAIIFIDEIDAIGRHRGSGMGGGNDEREQTLNQILVEMDGFEPTEKLIVMAATNRPDVLDPALLRPGRFDRRVTLDAPDLKDREEILAIHAKKKPLGEDVNLHTIAERTPGFSGADLASLMNEAAIVAAREDRKKVTQYDLIRSVEKVMLGPERKSHILSKQEKKITAYHEMGHALAASVLPNSDPVHKVSIISRGYAAGYTLKLPLEDRRLQSRKEFLDDIAVSLAGYAAEKMIFGDITTGASNDIAVSSSLARAMVTRYGMSEKIGPVSFEAEAKTVNSPIVVGDRYSSEATGATIDGEVSRIMTEALGRANEVLTGHKPALDMLAAELIKTETLEREDFEKLLILNGIKPKTKPVDEPAEEISIVPDGIEKEIA